MLVLGPKGVESVQKSEMETPGRPGLPNAGTLSLLGYLHSNDVQVPAPPPTPGGGTLNVISSQVR